MDIKEVIIINSQKPSAIWSFVYRLEPFVYQYLTIAFSMTGFTKETCEEESYKAKLMCTFSELGSFMYLIWTIT